MNSMNDLTERQRQVLEFIQSVHQESGMGPSLREIEIGRAHV